MVVTDHNPLVHLQSQPTLSRRQARWAEFLQRFTFTWEHRPGRGNVADPLSRLPFTLATLKYVMVTRAVRAKPPPPIPSILGKRSRRPSVRFADPVVDLIPRTRVRATPTKPAPRVKPRASSRRPSKLETAPSALAPPGTVPGAAAPAEPFDWDISLAKGVCF